MQRTEAWFARRAGKFTGSRFADLMAKTKTGPSASRSNLLAALAVERITGQCVDTYTNAAMQRGTDLEPEALDAYGFECGVTVEAVDFVDHPTLAMVGVSPDGLVGDDGLVEIKCPSAMAKHLSAIMHGDHAREYHWQVQGQMWVTGRQWCDVVSYDPRWPTKLQVVPYRLARDEDAIAQLSVAVEDAEAEVQAIVTKLQERM